MSSIKVTAYLKKLAQVKLSERSDFMEHLRIKNYGLVELTETEMWILTNAADNTQYLNSKLKEAGELSLDSEAPDETEDELSLDDVPSEDGEGEPAASADELSFDDEETTPAASADELSFDDEETAPTEGGDELSLDAPAEELPPEEVSDDSELDDAEEETEEEEPAIETSLAGVGILPLLAEIQEKLANGKPSEVELAALKAMKKLF